jgi:hypothetical protein
VTTIVIGSTPDVLVLSRPGARGPAGPVGPAGAGGNGAFHLAFVFNDVTMLPLTVVPAGARVTAAKLFVTTPFDGTGAQLSIGSSATPDLVMSAADCDAATAAVFESSPGVSFGSDTELYLHITAGVGASQGAGVVHLEIDQ